jgi:hypothetical protein
VVASSFIKGVGVCDAPRWTVGSDGWTTFNPSPDSRIIYVANAGSDANDGLTTSTPKQSLAAGYGLLRDGKPDQLLLNRGDIFTNGWIAGGQADGLGGTKANASFQKSGRSRQEPMVIGAYGNLSTARPKIVPLSTYYSEDFFDAIQNNGGNLAVQSIEFYINNQDPNSGSYATVSFTGTVTSGTATITSISSTTGLMAGQILVGPGVNGLKINSIDSSTPGAGQITMSATTSYSASGVEIRAGVFNGIGTLNFNGHTGFLYFEDCYLNYAALTLSQSTPRADVEVIINRCAVANVHIPLNGAQGIFMSDFGLMSSKKSVKTYECFLFNNGWHPQVWGADSFSGRNHNAYCHDIHWTHEFVRNITARAPVNGYMQRNGSLAHSNAYLCNSYAGTMGTGIRPNPLNFHDNVIIQAADQEQPYLVATAASAVGAGSPTITFTGIPSNTSGVSPHQLNLYNMDNPGSLAGRSCSATTGTTMTISGGAIQAGTRGNGVQVGDRIVAYTGIANGYSFGPADAVLIANPPGGLASGNTGYSTGSTGPFYVAPDKPIPSWVNVGHHVQIDHNVASPSIKFAAGTTVASIDPANRLWFTTSSALLGNLIGGNPDPSSTGNGVGAPTLASGNFGEQAGVSFFDPANSYSSANLPTVRWGPNNIVANGEGHSGNGSAMVISGSCINCDMSGNYFYKHNSTPANNIVDNGQNSTTSPQTLNSNATVTAYDAATIEGYMTSLGLTATKDAFYAGCLANRRFAWDPRYTAFNLVNYIRSCFGVSALATPTYPNW